MKTTTMEKIQKILEEDGYKLVIKTPEYEHPNNMIYRYDTEESNEEFYIINFNAVTGDK